MVREIPKNPAPKLMPENEYETLLDSFMHFAGKYAVLLEDMQVKDGSEYALIEKGSLVKLFYGAETPGYSDEREIEGRQCYYCNKVTIEAYDSRSDTIKDYIVWARPNAHFSPDTDEEALTSLLDAMDFLYAHFGTGPELDRAKKEIEKFKYTFWDYTVPCVPGCVTMFSVVTAYLAFRSGQPLAFRIFCLIATLLGMAYVGRYFYMVKIFKVHRKPIEAWKTYDSAITEYVRSIPPDTTDIRARMLTATRLLPDHGHDSQSAGASPLLPALPPLNENTVVDLR